MQGLPPQRLMQGLLLLRRPVRHAQGNSPEELPEQVVAACRFYRLDFMEVCAPAFARPGLVGWCGVLHALCFSVRGGQPPGQPCFAIEEGRGLGGGKAAPLPSLPLRP